jgi:cysteine sulfinate desulfinase/cysteine desulfurase-like protein/anaerobic selenocysteine-containing dehydrogenase
MGRTRRAICGICSAGCWVEVTLDDAGRLTRVEADASSPLGMICRMGRLSPQIVYGKERLRHPLRRRGPKGTFAFERISWDEAYDTIVAALQRVKAESGPEATAIYTGSGSFELAFCDVFQPKGVAVSSASSVLFPFGSPNTLGVGALCYVSFAMIAPHVTLGGMLIDMFADIENAELVVVWGKNPAAHCPPTDFRRIEEAHRRGARIVVIDPRRTALATYPGAEWIPIRPGSDGALALALSNVLIAEELHDERLARDWTVGFEEFARHVQHYRPEVVERITGVPAATIRALARRIAAADGAAPVMYSGLEYSDGAVQAIRATLVLWALAGQLDRPGGHCFSMRQNRFRVNRAGHVANPDVRRAAGHNDFPVYTKYRGEFHAGILPKAVLDGDPYRIRLLLTLGASIISSWPQSALWRTTLGALDFLVCIDRQLTADAAYADIVLPAATYYEIDSYMVYDSVFRLRERVIEPVGEARGDLFILAELARRLGYGHLYPQTPEALLRHALAGSGFTLEDVRAAGGTVRAPAAMMEYRKWEKGLLRPDGASGFDTPSGKLEIASSILAEHGYDALPVYTEPGESPLSRPDLAEEFPLVFNSGARAKNDLHGLHLSVPELQAERPVPTVMMSTADAAERGIADGDRVRLSTRRGAVEMFAHVGDGICRGAIEASAMGGGPLGSEAWQRANVNELTDLARYDPISGFPVYKALLCQVERLAAGTGGGSGEAGEYRVGAPREARPAPARIYFDHNATTPLAREAEAAMVASLAIFGNPSALSAEGRRAHQALEAARRSIALLINATARRIHFTGGGSEANNLALKGAAFGLRPRGGGHLVTTAIEHPSVLDACRWLETRGCAVTYLRPDREGRVRPEDLEAALRPDTFLVSVMLANNETGAIQPVRELAAIARRAGAIVHTDAVQAAGKIPVDVDELGVDLLTLSGHKFHGPKGVGVLFARAGVGLEPLVHGGGQEHGLRSGTENLPGIVGAGRAAELALANLPRQPAVAAIRDRLQREIGRLVPAARLNGPELERLPNTLNMTLPGIRGESLVIALDRRGVALSSGSACHAGRPEPSHALLAMGLAAEDAHCAIRLSLGVESTEEEAGRFVAALAAVLGSQEETVRFVSCR